MNRGTGLILMKEWRRPQHRACTRGHAARGAAPKPERPRGFLSFRRPAPYALSWSTLYKRGAHELCALYHTHLPHLGWTCIFGRLSTFPHTCAALEMALHSSTCRRHISITHARLPPEAGTFAMHLHLVSRAPHVQESAASCRPRYDPNADRSYAASPVAGGSIVLLPSRPCCGPTRHPVRSRCLQM